MRIVKLELGAVCASNIGACIVLCWDDSRIIVIASGSSMDANIFFDVHVDRNFRRDP
jgi:hypothetical protein